MALSESTRLPLLETQRMPVSLPSTEALFLAQRKAFSKPGLTTCFEGCDNEVLRDFLLV